MTDLTTRCVTPSTVSTPSRLASIAERVSQVRDIDEHAKLPPLDDLRAVIEAGSRQEPTPEASEAAGFVRLIVGSYPRADVTDPEVYAAQVATLLTRYPLSIAREVAGELPLTSKWLPRVSEVRDALEARMTRRRAVVLKAQAMVREIERRKREEEREARWRAIPKERREAQVEALRKIVPQEAS